MGKPETDHMEDLGIDGKIILKKELKINNRKTCTGLI